MEFPGLEPPEEGKARQRASGVSGGDICPRPAPGSKGIPRMQRAQNRRGVSYRLE